MLFECNCLVANGFGTVKNDNMSEQKIFLCISMENQMILNK